MNRYTFHPEAYGDLEEHWEYIAEHGSVDAADSVIADVFDALDTVASFPHMGHTRPDLTSLGNAVRIPASTALPVLTQTSRPH